MSQDYNESSIQIKEGLEAVRARPGMYIGDSGVDGLHHLIWEIADNSVDEHMEGHCSEINLSINADNSFTVIDNGRGIPVGIHPTEGISTATVVFTILHAGGKFDASSYKTSGGLHGVGASVTNALSEWLDLEIKRDGKIWFQRFEKGIPVEDIKEIGKCDPTANGTKVTFKPDPLIFKETTTFEDERVTQRLKEISFLNKGLKLTYNSEITDKKAKYFSKNGLNDYMKELCPHPLYDPIHIANEYKINKDTNVTVDIVMVHGADFKGNTMSFANNIRTTEHGTHVIGSINGFTKALMDKKDLFKIKDVDKIKGENFKDGLYSIITIKLSDPEFRGQTKGKLNNQEARSSTYNSVKEYMEEWIDRNEKTVKEIFKKAIYAKKAQEAMDRAYELVERKSQLGDGFMLPGKLSDCQSKNPQECEILIVEGDSAGGSAKQARNRRTQAVLPLKGKPLNAHKNHPAKTLKNEEIQSMIKAMGCGYKDNIDLEKLRYHKIIIMTDADVDGSHIQTLLLGFFYNYFPELIEAGHLYIAQPPLYFAMIRKVKHYIASEEELVEFKRKNPTIGHIQRFKGLGEMNPEQLEETTMDPAKRTLVQVTIDNKEEIMIILDMLLGEDLAGRREFISSNSHIANIDL